MIVILQKTPWKHMGHSLIKYTYLIYIYFIIYIYIYIERER